MTTEELRNSILLELLQSGEIKIKEKITYEKFEQLYSRYNSFSRCYFSKILQIPFGSFCSLSYVPNYKAIILSNYNYEKIKSKEKIRNELIQNKILIPNQKINYEEFSFINQLYPYLGENDLADVLGIKMSRLQNLKYKSSQKCIVLKDTFVLTREEEKMIQDMIDKKYVYPGMQIDYNEFKKLKSKYKDIGNRRFAYMLEITQRMYYGMQYDYMQSKPLILKSRIKHFIEEKKKQIIEELISNRHLIYEELIDYSRFLELYNGFEYISEVNFAKYILNINYNTFRSLKSNGKNVKALKKWII